jgi:uncharacterized membrane protein
MEFSTASSIRFGWETFKKRPWFFVGIMLLVAVVSGVASAIGDVFGNQGVAVGLGFLVNFVLSTLIGMGTTAFFLKAHDTPETVESTELWHPKPFWKYLGATLLSMLIIVGGLILLLIPGIIFSLMLMFVAYIVIDRGLGPVEAIGESRRIARGHKWELLGFALALAGVNILGFFCLIVGLLVSIPVSSLAMVHAYRTLSGTASSGA